jgi:hypothetical protein
LYTDGICEALNTSRDEFGVEHLQETIQDFNTLPLEELIPRIIKVVQDYAGRKKLKTSPSNIISGICWNGRMIWRMPPNYWNWPPPIKTKAPF